MDRRPGRIVARLAMSLDGYIADKTGGYDWIQPDVDDHLDTERQIPFDDFLETVDLVVMGRHCFDEGAAADYRDKQVVVATTRVPTPAASNIRFVGAEVVDVVRREAAAGGTVFLFGGGVLIDSFLAEQAVDELVVGVVPVLLGSGRRLFGGTYPTQELTLRDYTIVSGKVRLEYVRREP